jgi:hypothetical protein
VVRHGGSARRRASREPRRPPLPGARCATAPPHRDRAAAGQPRAGPAGGPSLLRRDRMLTGGVRGTLERIRVCLPFCRGGLGGVFRGRLAAVLLRAVRRLRQNAESCVRRPGYQSWSGRLGSRPRTAPASRPLDADHELIGEGGRLVGAGSPCARRAGAPHSHRWHLGGWLNARLRLARGVGQGVLRRVTGRCRLSSTGLGSSDVTRTGVEWRQRTVTALDASRCRGPASGSW